ncbi:MAG: immunoglobulin-like domain-containing protein [Thermoleophilaceae bacterium]
MIALRLAALVATLALVAPGCDGDDDTADTTPPPPTPTHPEPKPPPEARRGVVLELDRDSAAAGETLELTVENHTPTRLEYGVAYRLERRTADGWRWVNRDAAFILILKVVESGAREREDILLPEDLEPGRYRIVKSFTAPPTDREFRATVEFSVT